MFAPSVGSADGCVEINTVTGPHSTDRRRRTSLRLDHALCRADISVQYERGLHFVGYWHTHPEPDPRLSGIDERALMRNLLGGGLEIERMIAVVVGNGRGNGTICAYLVHRGLPVQLQTIRNPLTNEGI